MTYQDDSQEGTVKQALVRVNLCNECAIKLNYKKMKDKLKKKAKKEKKKKEKKRSKKSKKEKEERKSSESD
jgi:protein FRA10AC1